MLGRVVGLLALVCWVGGCKQKAEIVEEPPRETTKKKTKKRKTEKRRSAVPHPEESAKPAGAWEIGGEVSVEITLMTSDYNNLSCAMKGDVRDFRCAFESESKRIHDAEKSRVDPLLLQPVTTVDRHQIFVAGLWTQAPLKEKLDKENFDRPSPRFTAACRFRIVGKSTSDARVQWKDGTGWHPGADWWVGTLSGCTIQ